MTEQKESYKNFIEDLARIWLEYIIVYSVDGIDMEQEVIDPMSGEEIVQIVNVPQTALQQLQATVKIDVTPKSVYDRFAQEQTIENLLMNGYFMPEHLGELRAYAEALDDDSVAPKQKILEIVEKLEERQKKIAMIDSQARLMQQQANQYIMGDPDGQSSMMADAMMQLQAQQEQPIEEEIPEELPVE
jgi:hypothetical protein